MSLDPKEYQSALPFPHAVIDDFMDPKIAYELESLFPKSTDGKWWTYENVLEKKLARNDIHRFPSDLQTLIAEFQSNIFVSFLEHLTGIQGLIVDHTLNGGGLHQILRGGKHDIHADYNYHPITKLDRRLNVLFYLNSNWKPEWGGNLELWNADMTKCERSIQPIINRMVIFNVTDTAFHGHPDPLECPEGESRKSLALYYYTNGRPSYEKSEPHSTLFKRRPQDPVIEEHEQLRQQRAIKRI
jgi:hypothetical protein